MKDKITNIVNQVSFRTITTDEAIEELLLLFSTSKNQLLENIIDDIEQSYSEYAIEKIKNHLDNNC